MRALFLTLLILLGPNIGAAGPIEDFDLRSYSPIKNGLKDLYCEVRLKGLTEKIKKQFVTLKINKEVFFKLYWMYPGKVGFAIEGLPKGFAELRQNLKNLVASRIDFIIPQELSPKLRSYKLKVNKSSSGFLVVGEDPTNNKAVNKLELNFKADGRLSRYKSYSPLGFQQSSFSYAKKSWSKNKWVLEQVLAKTIQGPQITESTTKVEYENQVGFGFPTTVRVKTKQYVAAPGKEERKQERVGESQITFSAYKINSGTAQKYFRSQE
jgi:hypothetical protein